MSRPDYRVSDNPAWQPYRDPDTGEVVTLSTAQCAAVRHAIAVVAAVVRAEEIKGRKQSPAFHADVVLAAGATSGKSCLLGRLLYDGKPPLVDAPPVVFAAPDYSVEQT